jgi:hypothetical protein
MLLLAGPTNAQRAVRRLRSLSVARGGDCSSDGIRGRHATAAIQNEVKKMTPEQKRELAKKLAAEADGAIKAAE